MNRTANKIALGVIVSIGLGAVALQSAYADDNDHGDIHFTGKVLANTCTLDSKSLQVPMGTVGADAFKQAGTFGRSVPFAIQLSNCDAALKDVSVELDGAAASGTEYLDLTGGTSAAQGLAIELLDKSDKHVPINSVADPYPLQAGGNQLNFKARYVSTADAVQPGDANATAQFELMYR